MWELTAEEIQLPPGFSVKEEEDFVHLFRGDKKVATFSARVSAEEIIKETERKQR